MWMWFHKLSSPRGFYTFCNRCLPFLAIITALLMAYGIVDGLAFAPADYQQGDGFRIIYIHVPSAFTSLMVYGVMTVAAIVFLIWRIKLADWLVNCSAPLGTCFTLLALVTGSLWGKPMWGAWWIWDARLTSELILLFIYIGILALHNAFLGKQQGAIIKNIFVVIGSVNLPIIHYSVYWWSTLHQGSTLNVFGESKIAPSMARPLVATILAFSCFFVLAVMLRLRNVILWESRKATWIKQKLCFMNLYPK